MTREPHCITLTRESFPTRICVSVEPRTVTHPPARFATDEDAEEAAARLRDETGFQIVDRREVR